MLQATTKLEAINYMLSAVGEAPITNLNDDLAESEIAQELLTATSREIQSKGWSWNTQIKREILPAANSEVILPINTLRVDAVSKYDGRTDKSKRYTNRGGKLYDVLQRTNKFDDKVYLDIVEGLDWDDLTEAARRYILLDATSRYMLNVLGADTDLQQIQMQAQRAWITLEQEEDEVSDRNILTDQHMLSFASQRTRMLS